MKSLLLLTAALFLCTAASAPGAAAAGGTPLSGTLFVVDPGHGTKYPDGSSLNVGAVGPDGIEEKQVTLDVSEDLAALLPRCGGESRSHEVIRASLPHGDGLAAR